VLLQEADVLEVRSEEERAQDALLEDVEAGEVIAEEA